MHKKLFTLLIFISILYHSESRPGGELSSWHGGGGEVSAEYRSGESRPGGELSSWYGGGGEVSAEYRSGEGQSILRTIFSAPLTVPKHLASYGKNVLENLSKSGIGVILFPARLGKYAGKFVFTRVSGGLSIINGLTADTVVNVMDTIKAVTGGGIKLLVKTNVAGIQSFEDFEGWIQHRVTNTVDTTMDLILWVLKGASNGFDGSLNVLKIRQILHIPTLSEVKEAGRRMHNRAKDMLNKHEAELAGFLDSIIDQDQAFFKAFFHKRLTDVLTMADALNDLENGNTLDAVKALLTGSGKQNQCYGNDGEYNGNGEGEADHGGDSRSGDGGERGREWDDEGEDELSSEKEKGVNEPSDEKEEGEDEPSDEKEEGEDEPSDEKEEEDEPSDEKDEGEDEPSDDKAEGEDEPSDEKGEGEDGTTDEKDEGNAEGNNEGSDDWSSHEEEGGTNTEDDSLHSSGVDSGAPVREDPSENDPSSPSGLSLDELLSVTRTADQQSSR